MRFLLFLLLLLLISCTEDIPQKDMPQIDHSQLVGHWNIDSALRNGKKTNTLDDAYIQFSTMHDLSTNIFGETLDQKLIWQDSTASLPDSSITYKVKSINKDTLNLSFSIQQHTFDILFLREIVNEEVE